ncbi:MAG TPA: homocysteine S-methyltransferase [Silvibacterium sp.]|nr:homocysteine S-methyltransferase [Silvibacterium sp.]
MRSHFKSDLRFELGGFDLGVVRVLDGGMATELERRGCNISGPLWSAHVLDSAPEKIAEVHLDYLRAGADCISTVSYQVSAMGYAELGRPASDAAEALRESVAVAAAAREDHRRESDRPVFIAASLGPYGAALHNGAEFHGRYDIGFDALVEFHAERLAVITETQADLVALETVPSLEEARAIAAALGSFPSLFAWVSFTCRDAAHVAHGEQLAECTALFDNVPQLVAVGINCTAPHLIGALIAEAKIGTSKPIFVYPNSGELWDAANRRWYGSSDVAEFAGMAVGWYSAGAQAVGGCCRTTPAHVRAVREVLDMRRAPVPAKL